MLLINFKLIFLMKTKTTWMVSLLIVIFSNFAFSQEKTITGTVTD